MLKQFASSIGAVFTGACCLGFAPFLAGLSAIGAGFLVNDLILIPLFLAFLALTLWLLWQSHRRHAQIGPFYVALAGGGVALITLWFFAPASYAGLGVVLAASVWDSIVSRRYRQAGTA